MDLQKVQTNDVIALAFRKKLFQNFVGNILDCPQFLFGHVALLFEVNNHIGGNQENKNQSLMMTKDS